jgi:hypothetical protein
MKSIARARLARSVTITVSALVAIASCTDDGNESFTASSSKHALSQDVLGSSSLSGSVGQANQQSSPSPIPLANSLITIADAGAMPSDHGSAVAAMRAMKWPSNDSEQHPLSAATSPPLRERRILYRGQGLGGDTEKKEPENKPLSDTTGPAPVVGLSNDEYLRRSALYLLQWESEKLKYSGASSDVQEAARAQLKRDAIGE